MTNRLYYGDNLDVLRDHVGDASVDLVYLDPPFNSNASYNILFRSPTGAGADASIEAFDDTWSWGPAAAGALMDITSSGNHRLHVLMQAMRTAIGDNAMMAYLAMMAVRLQELHRVLKPTGSLYLHCDPTASHYLKLVLDAVFGVENFRNEIYWYYYNKMHDSRKRLFSRATDTILFYVKDMSSGFTFNNLKEARQKPAKQLKRVKLKGRMVNARDEGGNLIYQVKEDRHIDNVWRMPMLQPASSERLGYPTQKPRALLERIISASSNPGDVVLDPFCGCGTAVDAAQKLGRQWIGIDITHLAIGLIEKRLREGYGDAARFETIGSPRDLASALRLAADDPHQFQHLDHAQARRLAVDGREEGRGPGRGRLFLLCRRGRPDRNGRHLGQGRPQHQPGDGPRPRPGDAARRGIAWACSSAPPCPRAAWRPRRAATA